MCWYLALPKLAGGSRPSVSARSPLVRHRHASPVQQRRRKPNSPAISSPEKSQSDVDGEADDYCPLFLRMFFMPGIRHIEMSATFVFGLNLPQSTTRMRMLTPTLP